MVLFAFQDYRDSKEIRWLAIEDGRIVVGNYYGAERYNRVLVVEPHYSKPWLDMSNNLSGSSPPIWWAPIHDDWLRLCQEKFEALVIVEGLG